MNDERIDALVAAVLGSPKYQPITPDLVRRVGARELAARRNLKAAVKATKNKLHQVGGAYLEARIDYEQALIQLREAADTPLAWRDACRQIMRRHASTNERLPILDDFYATILAGLPPIHSVLDVACGLNPLALPWMPLAPGATYIACDIYTDLMQFLQEFFALAGVNGQAEVRDVIGRPPAYPVDLALVLKTLPCLEQVEKTAAVRLLDALQARYLLISFPAQSLGGRRKGMVENYEAYFYTLIEGRNWQVRRFEFATEVAFLAETAEPSSG